MSVIADAGDQSWSQFLTFVVNEGTYGIEVTKIREIKG